MNKLTLLLVCLTLTACKKETAFNPTFDELDRYPIETTSDGQSYRIAGTGTVGGGGFSEPVSCRSLKEAKALQRQVIEGDRRYEAIRFQKMIDAYRQASRQSIVSNRRRRQTDLAQLARRAPKNACPMNSVEVVEGVRR